MGREVVQLVTEIVTDQVAAASRKMEADYRAAVGGMDRATKQAQASVDRLGANVTNVGRIAMGAGRALSAGIGAASAAAAGAERSWVSLGTVVLASFAAGGPIAGGIAIVAAGIGMMAGESKRAAAAASEARAAQAKWLDQVREKAASAAAEIQKMRDAIEAASRSRLSGTDVSAGDIVMERDLLAARAAVREAEEARALAQRGRAAYLAGGAAGGGFGGTRALPLYDSAIKVAENARAEAAARVLDIEIRLGLSAEASAEAMRGQAHAKERTAAAAALAAVREAEAASVGRASAAAETARARLDDARFRSGLSAADRPFGDDLSAARAVEAQIAQVRAAADRLRAEQARLAQAAFVESGQLGSVTRGALEGRVRGGLAGELGVAPGEVEAEIQRRVQAYASEDSALRRQRDALAQILALTRETASAEAMRAGSLASVALGREAEGLAVANRTRSQTDPIALDVARMQGQASSATDPAMRAAIESRIQARTAELAVLEAQRAKTEALLALEQRLTDLRAKTGLDPAAIATFERESRASIEAAYAQTVALSTARGVAGAGPAVADSMRGLVSTIEGTLGQGLTSAIVDGITNGGRRGADIFQGIVSQLLSQTISSILQSGIQAAIGGLFGGIGGGGVGGGGGILSSIVGAVGGGAGPVGAANIAAPLLGATGGSGSC